MQFTCQTGSNLNVLFQTNPTYFGKLIFKISANKTTNFMQSVILSVYNYASNQREEYLLLKLFKTALQEEIEWEIRCWIFFTCFRKTHHVWFETYLSSQKLWYNLVCLFIAFRLPIFSLIKLCFYRFSARVLLYRFVLGLFFLWHCNLIYWYMA